MERKIFKPQYIHVGAKVYRVSLKEDLSRKDGYNGITDHQELKIEIEPLLNNTRKTNALLHEIVHAISSDRALCLEEDVVETFANGLHQALESIGFDIEWSD